MAVTVYLFTVLQMRVPLRLNTVLIKEALAWAMPGFEQIQAVLQSPVHLPQAHDWSEGEQESKLLNFILIQLWEKLGK